MEVVEGQTLSALLADIALVTGVIAFFAVIASVQLHTQATMALYEDAGLEVGDHPFARMFFNSLSIASVIAFAMAVFVCFMGLQGMETERLDERVETYLTRSVAKCALGDEGAITVLAETDSGTFETLRFEAGEVEVSVDPEGGGRLASERVFSTFQDCAQVPIFGRITQTYETKSERLVLYVPSLEGMDVVREDR